MKKGLLIYLILIASTNLWTKQLPYQNPNLKSEQRANDLISRLTLSEKATLMYDVSETIQHLALKRSNIVLKPE